MFRITEDPSSGRRLQCLAKNYKNECVVSAGMDKVSVMAAYSDPLCVCVCVRACSSLYMKALTVYEVPSYTVSAFIYSELQTRTTGQNMLP